jgi:serine/threonine-protein kinase
MPPAEAIRLAREIAAGLAAAHEVGVVHRDLKPDNVLLASSGRVALTDFGIAASFAAGDRDATTSFVGTPDYMAPEQVDGSMVPDARTDLYALGALLYELLSGRTPFSGPSALAIAAARLTRDPTPLRQVAPTVPPALEAVVMRCLRRSPNDRHQSVAELLAELDRMPDGVSLIPAAELPKPTLVGPPSRGSTPAGGAIKVAVLPFVDIGLGDHGYLSLGLTEDLIDSLSASKTVRVVSRGAAATVAGQSQDPRQIGRELGVEVVLHGTLRRAHDERVIAIVRMVSVADGIQIWSHRFESTPSELLKTNDVIAKAILAAVPGGAQPQETELGDPIAVDLYLRARSRFRDFWEESSIEAEQLFAQAVARAPSSPLLVAGHAHVLARCAFFDETKLEPAERAAERALELGPDLGEAHVAAGNVAFQRGRPLDAIRFAQAAASRSPSLVESHVLRGRVLAETGPLLLAERAFETALGLDPRAAHAMRELMRVMGLLGRWDRVKLIVADPLLDPVSRAMADLRFAFWWPVDGGFVARRDALVRTLEDARPLPPGLRQFLVAITETTPDGDGVDRFLDVLDLKTAGVRRKLFLRQIAIEAFTAFGQHARALEMLRLVVAEGLADLAWLDHCPALDALRPDGRFSSARAIVEAHVKPVWEFVGA